jgi:hypothetical protein
MTAITSDPRQPSTGPGQASAVTLDLPSAPSWTGVQMIFSVDLDAGGQVAVGGERLTSDEALQARAKLSLAQHPELRAVVRAERR